MKNFFNKIFKDKRILVIYILVIILIIAGVTYALNISSLNLVGTTSVIGIDEDAYGETSIDTSDIKLRPILDSEVETSLENVIKIDFLVGGNRNNTTDDVIYDIALVDLEMDDELSSSYVKWKLVKKGSTTFYDDFSDVSSGERVVLTTEQQDLVPYNEDKSLYDSYTFYLWLSDSCQEDLDICYSNGNYIEQDDLLNKHISGKIEVELYTGSKNGQGTGNVKESVNAAQYVMNLYDEDAATDYHIGGDTSKPTVSMLYLNEADVTDITEKWGIMKDNSGEYRYFGKSPNNYVEYNGELWRIISSSKVFSNENDTIGEQRLRIILDDSLGDYAWNNDYISNWGDSTLMCQLNTLYYNDIIVNCQNKSLISLTSSLNNEARNLIDNALWYLGSGPGEIELYADDYYSFERGNIVAEEDSSYRWIGKVGIMYPSDYAYATNLSLCTYDGINYGFDDCYGTDWLYNSISQWTISSSYESSAFSYYVSESGYINDYGAALTYTVLDERTVRPVVVLKSNVTITGGEGTSGNPYQLSLNK